MEKKFYELVAWTVPDGVRVIPSMEEELEKPYLNDIEELEDSCWESAEEEKAGRIALSKAYERLADFRLRAGRINQAYSALEEAAFAAIPGSDILWLYAGSSYFPSIPLLNRFLAMHRRVLKLVRKWDLEERYRGSELEKDYLCYTSFDREVYEEFRQGFETIKAWNFGK